MWLYTGFSFAAWKRSQLDESHVDIQVQNIVQSQYHQNWDALNKIKQKFENELRKTRRRKKNKQLLLRRPLCHPQSNNGKHHDNCTQINSGEKNQTFQNKWTFEDELIPSLKNKQNPNKHQTRRSYIRVSACTEKETGRCSIVAMRQHQQQEGGSC